MLEYALRSVLKEVTTLPIMPLFITKVPGITYTDTPISTGIIREDQVEIKIIHDDYDEALKLKEDITNKLNIKYQDKPLLANNISFIGELAGGGSLFNDSIQVWELSLIFVIRWRRLNNE